MDKYYMCLDCGWTVDNNTMKCKKCYSNNIADIGNGSIKHIDTETILEISRDKAFVESMCQLHDTDPIEYQLKMSQFRTQVEQQKQAEESKKPHCPHCSSTNISSIGTGERVGSIAMWGIFSKKINKSFKCKNCGYTW